MTGIITHVKYIQSRSKKVKEASKSEHPHSALLWDSGVLLAILHVVCTSSLSRALRMLSIHPDVEGV